LETEILGLPEVGRVGCRHCRHEKKDFEVMVRGMARGRRSTRHAGELNAEYARGSRELGLRFIPGKGDLSRRSISMRIHECRGKFHEACGVGLSNCVHDKM